MPSTWVGLWADRLTDMENPYLRNLATHNAWLRISFLPARIEIRVDSLTEMEDPYFRAPPTHNALHSSIYLCRSFNLSTLVDDRANCRQMQSIFTDWFDVSIMPCCTPYDLRQHPYSYGYTKLNIHEIWLRLFRGDHSLYIRAMMTSFVNNH